MNEIDRELGIDVNYRPKIRKPKRYNVFFLNDNGTPMDFVAAMLVKVFNKSADEAMSIMFLAHTTGRALAGTYTHEIAEHKLAETKERSKLNNHPLELHMEEEPN